MMDDKKFYRQMERLKQETFWEYLSHSYRFFLLLFHSYASLIF